MGQLIALFESPDFLWDPFLGGNGGEGRVLERVTRIHVFIYFVKHSSTKSDVILWQKRNDILCRLHPQVVEDGGRHIVRIHSGFSRDNHASGRLSKAVRIRSELRRYRVPIFGFGTVSTLSVVSKFNPFD